MNIDDVAAIVSAFADATGKQPTSLYLNSPDWESLATDARLINFLDPTTRHEDLNKDLVSLGRSNVGIMLGIQVYVYLGDYPALAYVD